MVAARFEICDIDLLDPVQHDDAEHWMEVHAQAQRETFGPEARSWTLGEIQSFHRSRSTRRAARAAWVGGRLVGAAEVRMPLTDNLSLAMLWLSVDRDHRRRGIGAALLTELEGIGTSHGRATFVGVTEWADGGRDASASFASRHGYVAAQTMRRSAMPLPADRDRLVSMLEVADDYALESAVDHLPERWLADRAVLQQRMSTDAPMDDLALEEEVWDADRVRTDYDRVLESGRRVVETVARHRPTGRLVAFTRVSVSAGEPALAYQQDTLVLREHRGYALGLRVKAATALRVMEDVPQVTAVRTWNALSNGPMLAVNDRLGYVVDGFLCDWQKVVS